MMNEEMIATAYESWIESNEYSIQSALESKVLKTEEENLIGFVGKDNIHDALDYICHIGYISERAGFEHGFRRGILFMMGIMKGGAYNA